MALLAIVLLRATGLKVRCSRLCLDLRKWILSLTLLKVVLWNTWVKIHFRKSVCSCAAYMSCPLTEQGLLYVRQTPREQNSHRWFFSCNFLFSYCLNQALNRYLWRQLDSHLFFFSAIVWFSELIWEIEMRLLWTSVLSGRRRLRKM